MNDRTPSRIPDNAIILLGKIGITNDFLNEVINSVSYDFSQKFHENLIGRKILSGYDGSDQWVKDGFPSQTIESGEIWRNLEKRTNKA